MKVKLEIIATCLVIAAAAALLVAFPAGASAATARASVIGGTPVTQQEFESRFSYQVALLQRERRSTFICGGSLIAPQWVLTAAHCRETTLESALPRFVVVGRAVLSDHSHGEVIPVEGSFQHPGWKLGLTDDGEDLMLIKLARPATTATPVALAPRGWTEPASAMQGTVLGWGLSSERNAKPEDVLRTADVVVRDWKSCRKNWRASVIVDTMICAGSSSQAWKSVCSGDSGGPLTIGGVQVGIVSFSYTRCRSNPYNVFTRTASYTDYIQSFMQRQLAPKEWYSAVPTRGPKSVQTIRLINPSAQPVNVEQVSIDRGPFRIHSSSCTGQVLPGGTCEVRVQAKRGSAFFVEGSLRVQSDSLAYSVFRVRLIAV